MNRNVPAAVLLLFLLMSNAFAQFETADVLGNVRDSSGAALVQTSVTLLNEGTGIVTKTVSDEVGGFTFLNVKPGTYTISAERAGFRTFSTPHVVVNVGARQRVDMTMQVGAITETVEVVG